MRWPMIAACWYIFGIAFCLASAALEYQYWVDIYYIWDKVKDVLFIAALLRPDDVIRKLTLKFILGYSILRVLWEIVSIITGTTILDQRATTFLFLVMSTGIATLLLKDLGERWKQNS